MIVSFVLVSLVHRPTLFQRGGPAGLAPVLDAAGPGRDTIAG